MVSHSICLSLSDLFHQPHYPLAHPCCHKWQDFILLYDSYSSYTCTTSLIHLSTDRYLTCFHILPIINSTALNIEVHISLQITVFVRVTPRGGIAGSYSNSVLWETSILISIVTVPIYILTNSFLGLLFLHILTNTCLLVITILTGVRW